MKKRSELQSWYSVTNMPFGKAIGLAALCYFLLLSLHIFGGSEFIYNQVVHPLDFRLRNWAGLYPKLDPRIKMYAVDHKTMTDMGLEFIPIEEWTALFQSLAKAKPQAIFIDKTFPLPLSKDHKQTQLLNESLHAASPVTASAFFVPKQILGFSELPVQSFSFDMNSLPWLKITQGYFYGPDLSISDSFDHIGHTNYEDDGYIKPIIRSSDSQALPFWGLNLDPGLAVREQSLVFNSHVIPTNDQGKVLVNLAPAAEYWKRTYSLVSLLKKARSGQELEEIRKDDIVLIFADMVQGATKFKNTPAGMMPGPFIMAEVLNNGLTGKWLKPIGGEPLFLLFACVLGATIALLLGAVPFLVTLFLLESICIGLGIYVFSFHNLLVPWAFPALGLFFTSILIFYEKARVADQKSRDLHFSLEGMIGPQKLKTLLRNNLASWLEPKSQVLTVMFIDIVGFSETAEESSPAQIFKELRVVLSRMADLVHESGGIVDRSMGDGLLCSFGYQYDKNSPQDDTHADQALQCAVRIQREAVERNLHAKGDSPFFPLRIGINTGEVYIGDLGGKRKVDLTLFGRSVNYAKRLEAACEVYQILCGGGTWDRLKGRGASTYQFVQKRIPVKHQVELGESYEFNPYQDDRETLKTALTRYQDVAKLKRTDERFVLIKRDVEIRSDRGNGVVLDYSASGISVRLNSYFGKGTTLSFNFHSQDGRLEAFCREEGLTLVSGEVRWSFPDEDGYRHGILFTNLTLDKKQKLLNYFRSL
ncbi:adenylate/guanylate cyclase domain-containing protein [Bdellovibrio sp. HCB337]|uniref:adenylate/guanylate cyclase domain-containing protein n=1 Tax=Bdellovibrio sp. HCB337 TaxID=3394358 RepID=UPI0039A5D48C